MRSRASLALLGLLWAVPATSQTRTSTPAPTPTPAATATPAPAAAPAPMVKLDYDSLAFARLAHGWFVAGEIDSLWAHTDPGMKEQMKVKEEWVNMSMQLTGRAGTELSVVEERWVKRNNQRQYWRIMNMSDFTDEPVAIRWVFLPGKMIGGLGMNPLSRVPPVDPN